MNSRTSLHAYLVSIDGSEEDTDWYVFAENDEEALALYIGAVVDEKISAFFSSEEDILKLWRLPKPGDEARVVDWAELGETRVRLGDIEAYRSIKACGWSIEDHAWTQAETPGM